MPKFKKTKLKEAFIKKFYDSAKDLQEGRLRQKENLSNKIASEGYQSYHANEFLNINVKHLIALKDTAMKNLDRYLKLIMPRKINEDKFYSNIQNTVDGYIDGQIRSLQQELSEFRASHDLKNWSIGYNIQLDSQVNGINNFKKLFKDDIKEKLFDYNLAPLNFWTRIREQFWLVLFGAFLGASGSLLKPLIRWIFQ